MAADACRNCRRPLHWLHGVGWLHGELPQYAGESITCRNAHPVCDGRPGCDHGNGPDPECACTCHRAAAIHPDVQDGGAS